MVPKAVVVGKPMVVLKTLVVLRLGLVLLVLGMCVVVEHARNPSAGTIQPAIMALLMVLGVHAGRVLEIDEIAPEGGRDKSMAPVRCSVEC